MSCGNYSREGGKNIRNKFDGNKKPKKRVLKYTFVIKY